MRTTRRRKLRPRDHQHDEDDIRRWVRETTPEALLAAYRPPDVGYLADQDDDDEEPELDEHGEPTYGQRLADGFAMLGT